MQTVETKEKHDSCKVLILKEIPRILFLEDFLSKFFGPEQIERLENVLNSYLKLTLETKY